MVKLNSCPFDFVPADTVFNCFNPQQIVIRQGCPPRWNSPCHGEGAYQPRSSNQRASTRRAQLSVAAKVVRPTDLLNHVKSWVNTDLTRLERPSLVKAPPSVWWQSAYMLAVHIVTVRLWAAAGQFDWHSGTAASLKVLATIVYDVVTKVQREYFPQHNIAGLISGITIIFCFSQEKPLRWKEIYTHTHTQVRM